MTQRKLPHAALARLSTLLVAAVVAGIAVAPAQAATVFQGGDGGVFVGGDETISYLFVTSPNASTIRVRSDVGTIVSGSPACSTPEANAVECPVTPLSVEVAAQGEDDIVDVDGPIASRLYGGAGADVLRGASAADFLIGEDVVVAVAPEQRTSSRTPGTRGSTP